MIDKDEYPQTAELEMRCVNMLSRLWNSPEHRFGDGMLDHGLQRGRHARRAGPQAPLAAKETRGREERRAAQHGHGNKRPDLLGEVLQLLRGRAPLRADGGEPFPPERRRGGRSSATRTPSAWSPSSVRPSTVLTSRCQEISDALDDLQERTGLDVPIHVDGASGGMIAPFLDPDLVWDFRLPRVASINTSGHKYGRVYPGVGWAIWRDPEALPEDLVFRVNYLGGDMPTFALNFSRPGSQIVAQYYNFLRLGFEGYRRVQQECRDMATYVSGAIAELGPFELITDGSELPVFAFKLRDEVDRYSAFDVSSGMRERGWQVPAYSFPENREDLVALRVVVRNGYSRDPADMFLDDLKRLLERLEKQPSPAHDESYAGFSH